MSETNAKLSNIVLSIKTRDMNYKKLIKIRIFTIKIIINILNNELKI